MNNFRTIDRQTGFLLPPSVDEWLPEKHMARFVVEVIDGLDLRAMSGNYRVAHRRLTHPIAVWLGERSYSLFLVHFNVFYLVNLVLSLFLPGRTAVYGLLS